MLGTSTEKKNFVSHKDLVTFFIYIYMTHMSPNVSPQ